MKLASYIEEKAVSPSSAAYSTSTVHMEQFLPSSYKYLMRAQATRASITMATTDKSKHMHEQPAFVRLFSISSLFRTRCINYEIKHK